MSALEIVHRGIAHRSNDFVTCCSPGCKARSSYSSQHSGYSMAVCMVYILDRPVGGLCARCKKEWTEAYDHALNGWPADVEEARAA